MLRPGRSTEVFLCLQAKLEDSGTRVSDLARKLVQLQVKSILQTCHCSHNAAGTLLHLPDCGSGSWSKEQAHLTPNVVWGF